MRASHDHEIGSPTRRMQVGACGTPAASIASGALIVAGTLLLRAIEVRDARQACLHRSFHHRLPERPDVRWVRHAQWPTDTMEVVGATNIVFRPLEEGQHGIPIPPGATELSPMVVVTWIATHVHHAVDRTGTAQQLATRQIERSVVQLRFRCAFKHPVDARIGKRLGVADWDMSPRIAVAATSLQ